MRQVTLRISDDLWKDLQRAAKERGQSANGLATEMLEVALRPDERGEHRAWVLNRLRSAGLLMDGEVATAQDGPMPTEEEFQAARDAAGRALRTSGRTSLSLLHEDRGWEPDGEAPE